MFVEEHGPFVTDDQVAFYQENGYIQLHDVLGQEELDGLRVALDEIYRTESGGIDTSEGSPEVARIFKQRVNLWRENDTVRKYVLDRRLAETARRLARVDHVRLWHDQALYKMPEMSKPTAWHQDLPYWPMNQSGALSCWMALDDVGETNGAMSFVARTHHLGRLEPINLHDPQDLFGLVPREEFTFSEPVLMKMRAGSCTFHNGLTFHGAGANETDRPRRAMVTIYMMDGTTYSGKPHIVTDGLGFEVGEPLTGEMFPIVA